MLLTDNTEARRLARRAKFFALMEGELYKRSHTRILQRCIPIEQGKHLLSVVLTPFAGAYDLLGVGYCSGPVEALSERLFD